MQLLSNERSVFVLIDVQGKLVGMVEDSERMLACCHRFLEIGDLFQRPVILTEQYPQGLGPTEQQLLDRFEGLNTQTHRVEKDSFGCCGEPAFEAALEASLPGTAPADRQVVLAGMETHICVLQTALALLAQGSSVFLAWDCVSGRGREYGRWALERMQQAGVVISNHESLGFELAGDKNHPSFRAFSALLREGQPGADQQGRGA